MKQRLKTVYVLRIRPDDNAEWSESSFYKSRKKRDRDGSMNRIMGGMRTHSYDEKKTAEELDAIEFADEY